jgi:deazaflavin-dependent oxidoreductase (nitroreductase family)
MGYASAKSNGDMSDRSALTQIETQFFRMLNTFVEPAVRSGLGSPRIVPGGLIVLETKGRTSGRVARLPLAATRIQKHVIVGTFRGKRSGWIRNLQAHPHVRFWLAGRPRAARAYVMFEGRRLRIPKSLPAAVQSAMRFLAPYTRAGWAFAVLAPKPERRKT